MVLLDEIHHRRVKVFLKLANIIWEYGLKGANMGKIKQNWLKNAVLASNNGRNAIRCQFAYLSYTPIINYEFVLSIWLL